MEILRRETGRFDLKHGKCEGLVDPPDGRLQQSVEAGLEWGGGAEPEVVIWRSCHSVWGSPMGVGQLGEGMED